MIKENSKARRTQLQVYGAAKRNVLDHQKDTWWAVAELAKGRTYREIAEELSKKNGYSVSHVQVWKDIENVLVEWKRENLENIDAYIAKDLARLEEIERIVMQNFEKSKTLRPAEYAALMKRGMTIEEIDEMYDGHELGGDPRYLDTLLRVQAHRLRLLGIDKGYDVPQNTIINYNFGDNNINDLSRITDMLQDTKKQEIDEQ